MSKIKIVGIFAFLGFIGGIIVNVAIHQIYPTIMSLYPMIIRTEWVLSGLAGSLLTTIAVVFWAYLSKPAIDTFN